MKPIICDNDAEIVINKIQDFIKAGGTIKDICIIEKNSSQIVMLLSDRTISQEKAKIWWNGYSEGLKVALE